ncbi:TM2 domain-containing protein [Sinomicrobium weinanense]|uniref:TM2 domain-containing protein n=1 Tax=Sinomicrobium weinanense TaxID=2842200 RepID=A0A926JQ66_9FLAO|nr:TM2 domain-containing protein [Sinomicrobium weinanense]MBC9795455.1 TM2 domain-containing protein [Sinomicrobium weinanense]MBU3123980.1 TM2 domain-containing protein [Sinomicrobium weinanense]
MSEENKNEENKEEKDFSEKAKDTAKEIGDEAKETAKEFSNAVKETVSSQDNKKILAGVLAIVVGGLGIHKFILGYNKEGIIQILLSFLCGIGGIIGIIEGIIYLTKSDEEFYNTYQAGKKPWF